MKESGILGRDIEEVQVIKLDDGQEALALVWKNPGQVMHLKITVPGYGPVDWSVDAIGLLVKERKVKVKKNVPSQGIKSR